VAGNDRKRQIARERYERRQAERLAARAKARQRLIIGGSAAGVVVIALVVLLIVLIGGNSTKKKSTSAAAASSGAASSAAASSPPPPTPTAAPGCTTKQSPVATPIANFPLLPAGVSKELSTEPSITVPAGAVPKTLQVKDLVVGTGATVTPDDSVTVDYLGVNYVDCTEFDSSWSRDEPATFSLAEVVPGFTKGIGGTAAAAATATAAGSDAIAPMKVGGRREIIVPPSDGYGTAGSPPNITGNEELIFVVDVLAASKTPAASTPAASPAATAATPPAASVPASTEATTTATASGS
jgi:peptidylprolyl isomerase